MKLFFNFIPSIRSKKTFRTNINLFDFKETHFQTFSNNGNYYFNIVYLHLKTIFFRFKYSTFKKLRNNLFNFITLNEDNFFF